MGGYGSGLWRSYGAKPTVEQSLTLDVNRLVREGVIHPGQTTDVMRTITFKGQVLGQIRLYTSAEAISGQMVILYGLDGQIRDTVADLVTTPCRFGGSRWWFRCPGGCGRRVVMLHLPPRGLRFACRQCLGLTYQACQDSHKGDALWVTIARERGLGWTPGLARRWTELVVQGKKLGRKRLARLSRDLEQAAAC